MFLYFVMYGVFMVLSAWFVGAFIAAGRGEDERISES